MDFPRVWAPQVVDNHFHRKPIRHCESGTFNPRYRPTEQRYQIFWVLTATFLQKLLLYCLSNLDPGTCVGVFWARKFVVKDEARGSLQQQVGPTWLESWWSEFPVHLKFCGNHIWSFMYLSVCLIQFAVSKRFYFFKQSKGTTCTRQVQCLSGQGFYFKGKCLLACQWCCQTNYY